MLSDALNIWSDERRRGIWIRIPTSHAHLIEPATKFGFDFQFAEPGVCVLTKWLPKDTESRLPTGPSHQIGVGVLVLHPITGKMLAVQERTGPAAARKLARENPSAARFRAHRPPPASSCAESPSSRSPPRAPFRPPQAWADAGRA